MCQTKIHQLNSEQKALISVYREKWYKTAFSVDTINRYQAKKAIKSIYSIMEWGEPEILFFHSLNDAVINLSKLLESRLEKPWSILGKPLNKQITQIAGNILTTQFIEASGCINFHSFESPEKIERQVYEKIWQEIQIRGWYFGLIDIWRIYEDEIKKKIRLLLKPVLGKKQEGQLERKIFRNLIHSAMGTFDHSLIDYFTEVLKFSNNSKIWNFEKKLYENSGCFLLCKKIAIVCDRPKKILTINQRYLHSEETPALEFRDDFKIYAHKGIAIPKKYGKVNSSQWQLEWLLTETDENVKYALRQGLNMEED